MFKQFNAFLDNLVTIVMVVSTASIVSRSLDTLVEAMIKKHPASRFWPRLDKALDGMDAAMQFLSDMLMKILVRRNEVPK